MPLSPRVAQFNKRFTNRITQLFAARVPGFALLTHIGRKSGKVYTIPINVFRTATGYRLALTYGPETDWVRNVLAAGVCTIRTRRGLDVCRNPYVGTDPDNRWAPWLVRQIIGRAGVTQYLDLTIDETAHGLTK